MRPPSDRQTAASATMRVRAALAARDIPVEILEFPESTRTAHDAARAIGTSVAQIVKSLVFVADERPVLVLASGANRVDLAKLAHLAGAAHLEKASAELTRSITGFSIGGVPPVGHPASLPVYMDESLLAYPIVYAAAGTPHTVFAISPHALARATEGVVADFAETVTER